MADDITLEWAGKPYKLPLDMRAIRQVERVLVRPEVRDDLQRNGTLAPTDISEIYTNLLNAAGASLTHQEVDRGLFGGTPTPGAVQATMVVILRIMEARNPPPTVRTTTPNPQSPAAPRMPSTKRRSKRASATGA